MKKRKLKGFVLPTLYMLITISIFTSVILLGNSYSLQEKDYNYGTDALKDNVQSVIVEDVITTSKIGAPVEEGKAQISIHFYNKNDSEDKQQSSLIYYENTYLPNTGVLYTSEETFNVINVFEGEVIEMLDDEFFGKYIVVEHTHNIRTYYYGLNDLKVVVGDKLKAGDILGISKVNSIMPNTKSFLLEVYYNNELINPENFIGTKITDYE